MEENKMKEISVKNSNDILHLELIEALGLLTAETVSNDCEVGEMIITKIGSNHGNFKYNITCERIETEEVSLLDKVKRWFK